MRIKTKAAGEKNKKESHPFIVEVQVSA